MRPIIEIRNLSKSYRLGVSRSTNSLRELIVHGFRNALSGREPGSGDDHASGRTLWALKNVSCDIYEGDILGVIGVNGSGKSTMLKILSRITHPTEGRVKIRGRIASLLEVGTGFHPELTGRENVYLNGAILGMRKAEIDAKFDEIVAFSEIERFLDTPVKRYSSGMYVRLAFSVAAHLDPEILLVDEVLAVGDVAFQRKCLGKMGEISHSGRTVFFVSHNIATLESICKRGIVLKRGQVVFNGNIQEGVAYYLKSISSQNGTAESNTVRLDDTTLFPRAYRPLLERLELLTEGDQPVDGPLAIGSRLAVRVHFRLERSVPNFGVGVWFDSLLGERLFTAHTLFDPDHLSIADASEGDYVVVCDIPDLGLMPGEYKLCVSLGRGDEYIDRVDDAARVTVRSSDYYGTGWAPWDGKVVLKHRWQMQKRVPSSA